MKIEILDNMDCNSEEAKEEYGSWSSKTEHHIAGAIKVTEDEYFDLEVNDDFLNKRVYLLYILYSKGDSFGTSTGNIEYIDVFENYDKALEVKKIIEEDYKRNPNYDFEPDGKDLKSLFYTKENGNKAKIPTCIYKGYFEDIESVNIEKITIKGE